MGTSPAVQIDVVSEHELLARLTAPTSLYFVHLIVPHGWTNLSDNYFDMRACELRTIAVRNGEVVTSLRDIQVVSG